MSSSINQYIELGRLAFQDGQERDAIDYMLNALKLAKREKNSSAEQIAGELLCDFYGCCSDRFFELEQIPEAIEATLSGLQHAYYLKSSQERVEFLLTYSIRLGNLSNNYSSERKFLLQALEIAQNQPDRKPFLHALRSLAFVELQLGSTQTALKYANQMWEQSKNEFRSRSAIGHYARRALCLEAECYCDMGQLQKTATLCEKGLEVARQTDDDDAFFRFVELAADCSIRLGDDSAAINYYELAFIATPNNQNTDALLELLSKYGEFLLQRDHSERAVNVIQRILPIQRQYGTLLGQARNFHNIAAAKSHVGDLLGAIEDEEKALHLYTQMNFQKGIGISRVHLQTYKRLLTQGNVLSGNLASEMVQAQNPDTKTLQSSRLRATLFGALAQKSLDEAFAKLGITESQTDPTIASEDRTKVEDVMWQAIGIPRDFGKIIEPLTTPVNLELISESEMLGILQQTNDELLRAYDLERFKSAWSMPGLLLKNCKDSIGDIEKQFISIHCNAPGYITCAILEAQIGEKSQVEFYFTEAQNLVSSLREQFMLELMRGFAYMEDLDTGIATEAFCRAIKIMDQMRFQASALAEERQRFIDINIHLIDDVLERLYSQKDMKLCLWAMEFFRSRSLLEKRIKNTGKEFTPEIDSIFQLVHLHQTAVMSFYQASRATFVLVIHPNGTEFLRISHKENNIPVLVERYVKSLQPPRDTGGVLDWLTSGLDWSAKELFETLLEPWFPQIERNIKGLIVAPHGSLAKLPIGTLPHLHKPFVYMIDALPILYTPNLSLLCKESAVLEGSGSQRLLSIGVTDFCGFPELPSLPGASQEAKEVAHMFADSITITDIQGKVSLQEVFSELERASMVHFATHADAKLDEPFNASL